MMHRREALYVSSVEIVSSPAGPAQRFGIAKRSCYKWNANQTEGFIIKPIEIIQLIIFNLREVVRRLSDKRAAVVARAVLLAMVQHVKETKEGKFKFLGMGTLVGKQVQTVKMARPPQSATERWYR